MKVRTLLIVFLLLLNNIFPQKLLTGFLGSGTGTQSENKTLLYGSILGIGDSQTEGIELGNYTANHKKWWFKLSDTIKTSVKVYSGYSGDSTGSFFEYPLHKLLRADCQQDDQKIVLLNYGENGLDKAPPTYDDTSYFRTKMNEIVDTLLAWNQIVVMWTLGKVDYPDHHAVNHNDFTSALRKIMKEIADARDSVFVYDWYARTEELINQGIWDLYIGGDGTNNIHYNETATTYLANGLYDFLRDSLGNFSFRGSLPYNETEFKQDYPVFTLRDFSNTTGMVINDNLVSSVSDQSDSNNTLTSSSTFLPELVDSNGIGLWFDGVDDRLVSNASTRWMPQTWLVCYEPKKINTQQGIINSSSTTAFQLQQESDNQVRALVQNGSGFGSGSYNVVVKDTNVFVGTYVSGLSDSIYQYYFNGHWNLSGTSNGNFTSTRTLQIGVGQNGGIPANMILRWIAGVRGKVSDYDIYRIKEYIIKPRYNPLYNK